MSSNTSRAAQRIAEELHIAEAKLKVETRLRDTLVSLGQPAGFKTAKMKWLEEEIGKLQRTGESLNERR